MKEKEALNLRELKQVPGTGWREEREEEKQCHFIIISK